MKSLKNISSLSIAQKRNMFISVWLSMVAIIMKCRLECTEKCFFVGCRMKVHVIKFVLSIMFFVLLESYSQILYKIINKFTANWSSKYYPVSFESTMYEVQYKKCAFWQSTLPEDNRFNLESYCIESFI